MNPPLEGLDAALIDMRRLWAPTTSGRPRRGADAGIDLSTVLVVTAVGGSDEGLSVAEVADDLGVAAATASRLCDRAVAGGYVRKAPSAADPRRLSLTLTPSGAQLRSRSRAFRLEYLGRLLADWEGVEIETFQRLLTRFAVAVHADPPSPTTGDTR